ncbi:hypothetical protein Emag_001744 [Eimeria magna]
MGARTAALFALFFLCFTSGELLTGCSARGVPSSSEDALDDERATESDLSTHGEDEKDQSALEAAGVDQPLSLKGSRRRGSYPRTSIPRGGVFAAGDSNNNSSVMGEGFSYQADEEEEEEEEDIYNTEELEVVRMIRLSREEEKEKPPAWGGIGDAVSLHAPTQVIMWVLLAVVVYFIMRGATRGEEKQKSLELHRGVLKTTIESLVRGKKENQRLRKQRDAMMRDRTVLLRETVEVQAELASMLSEIQQAGTLKGVNGVSVGQSERGEEQETGDSSLAKAAYQVAGITVPGFESGPAHLNKELHELIFNQGDTAFQEKAVSQLASELRQMGVHGGDTNEPLESILVKDFGILSREKVKQWFVSAADSVNASTGESGHDHSQKTHEAEGLQEGGAPRARTKRERKMDLLGLAAAMVRRKISLESELKDILERTSRVSAAEEAALPKIVNASNELKQLVTDWHGRLKGAFSEVDRYLKSNCSADFREAVHHAYAAAISTDVVLGKLIAFQSGNCQVSSEDLKKASEARFQLLQSMQQANKLLADHSKQLLESRDIGGVDRKDPANVLCRFFSMIEYSFRKTVEYLADLQSQLLVYYLEEKKKTIHAAPLNEVSQTLFAQLEQTDRWLEQAIYIFRHM